MKTFVLDASAVLRFTDKEPGFDRVLKLLQAAARGEVRLLISAVNWGEIVHAVAKRCGPQAQTILDNLASLPMTIVPVDAAAASRAAYFKFLYRLPYADAFAGALALAPSAAEETTETAALVTADNDFRGIPAGKLDIELLPGK
ncbi:MAG TPA: PIN domain-containing protein [Acidobacteriaceae bacterium]